MPLTSITLRLASGSYPTVGRVYAFSPASNKACVRFEYDDGPSIETVTLDELEAVTEDRRRFEVEPIVRRMAKEILCGEGRDERTGSD